jgi:hypothetical protein
MCSIGRQTEDRRDRRSYIFYERATTTFVEIFACDENRAFEIFLVDDVPIYFPPMSVIIMC